MFIRKFYEADVAEAGGGEVETVVSEDISPAAALAKFGNKSDENSVEALIDIKEKLEAEKTKGEETPTAKVEETNPDGKAATETPQETKTPTDEPKAEEKQPIVAETPKVQTLEEVLKTNQPDTVLKALGFDDEKVALVQELKEVDPKVVGIIQAWKSGQLEDYIKELAVDYSKMEAEDVMRHQLRVDYPKATEKQLEILYKKEIVEKYNLESDFEDEVADGKELLAVKADKYRDSLIEKQNKFLLPAAPEKKAEVTDNSAEQKAKENIETYVKEISNDPYTKDIIANKKITIGEGDEKFSYPVDYNSLIGNLTDGNKWASVMYDKDTGKLRTEHQLLISTVAEYGMDFLKAYALHFKGLGGRVITDKIDNAKPPEKNTSSKAEPMPTSAAAAMAKMGVRR